MTTFFAHDVSVSYGDTQALTSVSIDVRPGSLHGVIGGDGAGKSTLLKVLSGLDIGQQGTIRLPPAHGIGYVPSDGGIFGDLTVDENIEFVAAAYRLTDWQDRAASLLDRAAIGQFGDRLAGRMSGGQRRKLAGCLALLPRPELLVLDEVTTGVDPVSRMELWRMMTGAAADGAAVVIATTYLDEAERMESVLLLDRGSTLVSGTPGDIISSTPGSVRTMDQPTDMATAWRSGRRWRQWSPDRGPDGTHTLDLEAAAIVRELGAAGPTSGDSAAAPTVRHADPSRADPSGTVPVRVRHATKRFGDFTAVDDVDLDVQPGEIVGLVGANGAGKTTLIKMLLGLQLPTAGEIRLFGAPADLEQRRRIGYVPQNLGLYGDLTAAENLEFRAAVFGIEGPGVESIDDADRLIRATPLGRQRQLAFLAATQHRPALLVLDEPTSGVSPLARSQLWDQIHAAADTGVGVLVSTHYMDEAVQADRLVILSYGRVVAAGTADEVIAGRTVVEVVSDDWTVAFSVLDRADRQLRLAGRSIRILATDVDTVSGELVDAGIEAEVRATRATLEEVLIELDADVTRQSTITGALK